MDRRGRGVAVGGACMALVATLVLPVQLAGAGAGGCAELNFDGFDDTSELTLNGNAATAATGDGTVLRVTPANFGQAGSAFSTNELSLAGDASFSSFFSFRFSDQLDGGADGLVFVVQTVDNSTGGSGGGIGYLGIADSLGVEFDNYLNDGDDPNDNHVGINLEGSVTSNPVAPLPWQLDDPNAVHFAWVDYDGSTDTLEVRVAQSSTRPDDAFLTTTVDLVDVLGSTDAFVGFTSGTGASGANHDVIDWTMRGCLDPVGGTTTTSAPTTTTTAAEEPTAPAQPVETLPDLVG